MRSVSSIHGFLIRVSDIVIAALVLLLLSPLFLIVGIFIRLDSTGPILFRQKRIGQNGLPFVIYKFRTMYEGSDRVVPQFRRNQQGKVEPVLKLKNDPRVTRVGHYLRRFSIDELPQLINVLVGDMSLVGPRPSVPAEVALYNDYHQKRLQGKPGLTGLAQISGRTDLDFDTIVALDLVYLQNQTVWLYYKILLLTIPFVLSSKGAY